VRAIHDLRTRFSGDRMFVEYHLEVDARLALEDAHAIGDGTEMAVKALLPGTVEVTAHVEPYGIKDDRLDDRVRRAAGNDG
jgi:ferrous-iron efflux pump FieF